MYTTFDNYIFVLLFISTFISALASLPGGPEAILVPNWRKSKSKYPVSASLLHAVPINSCFSNYAHLT